MLRRTASHGPRQGLDLWRCEDRICRGIINIDPEDEGQPAPKPGESAQARFERERHAYADRLRRGAPVLAAVGVLGAAGIYFSLLSLLGAVWASVAAVGVVALFIAAIFRSPADVLAWQRGAEAERRIGVKLDELEKHGFVTMYDRRFPARGGNIDAIAVGPPGVFVVETKFRSRGVEIINGDLAIGGRDQPQLIAQAVEEALRVQISIAPEMNRHRMTVVPVLCFVNRKVRGGDRSAGVFITDESSIANRLSALPSLLDKESVNEIARQIDRALPRNDR